MTLGVFYFQTNHLSMLQALYNIFPNIGDIRNLPICRVHLFRSQTFVRQALDDLETAAHQVRLWLGRKLDATHEGHDASQVVIPDQLELLPNLLPSLTEHPTKLIKSVINTLLVWHGSSSGHTCGNQTGSIGVGWGPSGVNLCFRSLRTSWLVVPWDPAWLRWKSWNHEDFVMRNT